MKYDEEIVSRIKSEQEREEYIERYVLGVRSRVCSRPDIDQFLDTLRKCKTINKDEEKLKNDMFIELFVEMDELLVSGHDNRPPITGLTQHSVALGRRYDEETDAMELAARSVKRFDQNTNYGEPLGLERPSELKRTRGALNLRSMIRDPGK